MTCAPVARLALVGLVALAAPACGGSAADRDGSPAQPDGSTDRPDASPDASTGKPDAAPPTGPLAVYVGDYQAAIHVYTMDPATLALTFVEDQPSAAAPSFLAFDPEHRWLVAANEGADTVESFRIDPETSALTPVDSASSGGRGPAHLAVDALGAWVLVANYGDGAVRVLPIDADGTFGAPATTLTAGENAHQVVIDGANQVVWVPCLGDDRIARYQFDPLTGSLTPLPPTDTPRGGGPRHLAHGGANAWLLNETSSTITTYDVGDQGALIERANESSLPPGFLGTNTGAEIAVSPAHSRLYASNRGDDSIAVFDVDSQGELTLLEHEPSGGAVARHFSLSPDAAALLVANQDSGAVHGFRIDAKTGLLDPVGELTTAPTAAFVGVLQL